MPNTDRPALDPQTHPSAATPPTNAGDEPLTRGAVPVAPADGGRAGLTEAESVRLDERLRRAREQVRLASSRATIPRRPNAARAPLSFAQEGLWFIDQLEPGQSVYNVCQAVRIHGPLQPALLEKALNEIVRRHEVLRTNFLLEDGRPVQVVTRERPLALRVVALDGADAEAVQRRLEEESRWPFDLAQDVLIRALLVRTRPEEHTMMLTLHHIISDGWSTGVLFRELATLYQGLLVKSPPQLPDLPVQFADYAVWERGRLQGSVMERMLDFWRRELAELPPLLELPFDYPRNAAAVPRGGVESLRLPAALTKALHDLAQREGCTLFMVLLAAFHVLLHRWTGQTDLVVGSAVAGRNRTEIEPLIGFFVKTLVFRGNAAGNPSFRDMLGRVRDTTLRVLAHQEAPFERLVEELRPDRSLSRNPLFQVLFVLQNAPMTPAEFAGLRLSPVEVNTGTAKFDLTLSMVEDAAGMQAAVEYNADLFSSETIGRLLASFELLLEGIAAQPGARLGELPLLPRDEWERVTRDWNSASVPYDRDACVHQAIEHQAARTPDAIAVVGATGRLTYAELNARADALAARLRGRGVGAETLVGVFLRRTPDLLVAIVGILKAGGAYVPLDPAYPAERLRFIIEDTAMSVVVTERSLLPRVPEHQAAVVGVDDVEAAAAKGEGAGTKGEGAGTNGQVTGSPSGALPPAAAGSPRSDGLAYVIYTSGSTGRPKGVCLTHRGVMALVAWASGLYGLDDLAGVLFSTSVCFDVSVFESLVPLCLGGQVVIAENLLQAPAAADWAQITLVSGVPSVMAEVVRAGMLPRTVRTVNVAGEPCPQELVEALYATGHVERVYDVYGPTETTVYSIGGLRWRGERPTIGRPLPNEQAYILDAYRKPVPVGVRGELYIGGDKVARGYLNRPELTAERFVRVKLSAEPLERGIASSHRDGENRRVAETPPYSDRNGRAANPFAASTAGTEGQASRRGAESAPYVDRSPASLDSQLSTFNGGPEVRLYRTGDAARWLPDGRIEFLGRLDRQVKLRGFRIEPGEIEAMLRRHPSVRECAVTVRREPGRPDALVAYVVLPSDARVTPEALKAYAEANVPEYLVPACFVVLDALPHSPNGKLDLAALEAADGATAAGVQAYVAARDTIEQQLVEVWESVLGVKPVGIHDRFFDLGGHSLLAVRMAAQIEQRFGQKLPLALLFRAPTIERLARAIRDQHLVTTGSSLVEIQPHGSRPPIFWMHTLGGGGGAGLFTYQKLAQHLGGDQPSFGLVAPAERSAESTPVFEAMAAYYIREMTALRPKGPYHLGGYCFGGVLAYEMARQLAEAGAPVGLVVLLDSFPPNPPRMPRRLSLPFAAHLASTAPAWMAMGLRRPREMARRSRKAVWRALRGAGTLVAPPPAEVQAVRQLAQLVDMEHYPPEFKALAEAHWRSMVNYRPKPYPGRIVLFRTNRPRLLTFPAEFQWGRLAREVDVRVVSGTHENILEDPQAGEVAEALRGMLE